MFRLLTSTACVSSASLSIQRRSVARLHTSYHKGYLRLHSLTGPRPAAPKGSTVSATLQSAYQSKQVSQSPSEGANPRFSGEVDNEHSLEQKNELKESEVPARPFVPLSEVSRIELQGDYLLEGGQSFDALKYYGVVAKAYSAAYPENDNQRSMIAIKLSRAFRCCQQTESAVQNAEHALYMLDHNESPHLDLVCEALIELAEAKAARKDADAGLVFEDVMAVIDAYHSLGNSERTIRMMPRLGTRMGVGHQAKFFYITPFDSDRVFHLGDHAMERAETHYRAVGDQAGLVRVLERRSQLLNTKFFEINSTTGRMRTLRGYSGRHLSSYAHSSTPRELLMYSPTVHQVYLDRSALNNTPVGREEDAMPGANRRIMDDGHYLRRSRHKRTNPSVRSVTGRGVNSMSSIYDY